MEYLALIPVIAVSMFFAEAAMFYLQMKYGPKPINPAPKPVIATLLAELDLLIDLEILGVVEVPLMVKEIPLITDFKEVQMEIIHNVIDSLASSFIMEANKCGLKRAYILTYVTRMTHAKLLEFMKNHNLSLK